MYGLAKDELNRTPTVTVIFRTAALSCIIYFGADGQKYKLLGLI